MVKGFLPGAANGAGGATGDPPSRASYRPSLPFASWSFVDRQVFATSLSGWVDTCIVDRFPQQIGRKGFEKHGCRGGQLDALQCCLLSGPGNEDDSGGNDVVNDPCRVHAIDVPL